jgi:hypothetical protein
MSIEGMGGMVISGDRKFERRDAESAESADVV